MYALIRSDKIVSTYLNLTVEILELYPTVLEQEAAGYYLVKGTPPLLSKTQKIISKHLSYNSIIKEVRRDYIVSESVELLRKQYIEAGKQRDKRVFTKLPQDKKIQKLLERGI